MRTERISPGSNGAFRKSGLHVTNSIISPLNRCGSLATTPTSQRLVEQESRLSDTSLKWMLACAYIIPNGIKYDRSVLRLHGDPAGIQHDEVKTGFATIPNFFGITWTYGTRELPKMQNSQFSDATMHRSVYERVRTWTKFLTTTR